MSYDLQIWSVFPVVLPDALPESVGWLNSGGHWSYSAAAWQLVVGPSDRVLPEDLPDEVRQTLPGISYLTELNLSPIGTGAAGRRLLLKTAKALAQASHGVIFDPQEESVTTPSGVKRFDSLPKSASASLLNLSWWSIDAGIGTHAGVTALLDLLHSVLPEALPKRYGLWEPPQHRYAETGRPHLEAFLAEHALEGVVWYPHPPVADFHFGLPEEVGWNYMGFRSVRVSLEVDIELLAQPGWQGALRHAWVQLSKLIRPFYGEVRTLSGYERGRGTYWTVIGRTQEHPVKAWWWKGIPKGPAHAIVVGEPYQALWPGLADTAQADGELLFASTADWLSPDDVYGLVSPPPEKITQAERGYPTVWPFAPRPEV